MYPFARNSGYDRAITMFSPDGRLYQVEYASKIIEHGTPGIGIIYDDGVLLVAEKPEYSKLVVKSTIEKIFMIDKHIAAVSAGLVGDARRLIEIAREFAYEDRILYGEKIPVKVLVTKVASVKQIFTQYGGSRPFGVSLLIGGYDEEKKLYKTDPSGGLVEYKAVCIGRNESNANEVLEKKYKDNLNRKDALKLAMDALKATYDKEQEKKISLDLLEGVFIEKDGIIRKIGKKEFENALKGR